MTDPCDQDTKTALAEAGSSGGKVLTIAHVSDLHVGSQYFISNMLSRVIEELNELQPDAIIVTGDLTDEGFRQEYKTVRTYFKMCECAQVLMVPGNHDARNVGYVHFEEFLGPRNKVLPLRGATIIGVDSSEPDLDSGRVGREGYHWIDEAFAEVDGLRLMALHHHLLPVPGTGRERNIVFDAGDVLEVLVRNGVDIVLSGHKHVPHVWRIENMIVVNAGTAACMRLRGRTKPSYNILRVTSDHIQIYRKHPFGKEDLVADFQMGDRRYCRWEDVVDEVSVGGELP